jgi:hypothetical protein
MQKAKLQIKGQEVEGAWLVEAMTLGGANPRQCRGLTGDEATRGVASFLPLISWRKPINELMG